MKRLLVLVLLPLVLFALEKVNLIKDGGFEKDSNAWLAYTGSRVGSSDSAIVNTHNSQKAFQGFYSGSCDTRSYPGNNYTDSALIIQGFCCRKTVSDIDSLNLYFSNIPLDETSTSGLVVFIGVYLDSSQMPYRLFGYYLKAPDQNPESSPPWYFLEKEDFPTDSGWYPLSKYIHGDLAGISVSEDAQIDSFLVTGWGAYLPPWRGQLTFFDGIRLTGYADYDVGIKEILSGDSLDKDTPYTPIARIKNFGRENAPEFSVIAEIFEGTTRVYYDSLLWSLTSDTEDTVTFSAFTPSSATNHTLTVRTVMEPDESDEDDEMTKTLYGTGIKEQPIPSELVFEVSSFTTSPRVSYSLPASEQGTITLYDPSGCIVERLQVQSSGQVSLRSELTSGVYFVKLEAGKVSVTRKAIVLR